MIDQYVRQLIKDAIHQAFGGGLDLEKFEVKLEPDRKFGDFSSNVAMVYAKDIGKAPRDIANVVKEVLEEDESRITSVEIAGPGFINITMADEFWLDQLDAIVPEYGRNDLGAMRKVQVEYISANPTGPTTIGNARGGFIGDVLSNVLSYSGYDVTREYYFNNAGTQIGKLLESVKMEAGIVPTTEERQYRGQYIKELAKEFEEELKTDTDEEMGQKIANAILKRYIEPAVEAMGIRFDVWTNEKELIKDGTFDQLLAKLRERGLVFERDGAIWLDTGSLGDERKERVIVKSNGDPTYMAPDLAYHMDIFGRRGFDYAIKVLGPDHVAQFPSVYSVIHELFPDKEFRMASYQWLRVMRDGKEVKVSKRLGQFITIADLISEVGLPVARFLTLMRSADSHMDFDLDLAREQSAKNPYYYVMYAYARANSVLLKAENEKGLRPSGEMTSLSDFEIGLIKRMSELPGLVKEMAEDYGVHRLTFYGMELARVFQEYYESGRIIEMDAAVAQEKLYLLQRFVVLMDIYWGLLGIEPIKRMD